MRSSAIAALGLASVVSAVPRRHTRAAGGPDPEKTAKILDVYRESWGAYYRYAFPNDTLNPVSQTSQNDRYVAASLSLGRIDADQLQECMGRHRH